MTTQKTKPKALAQHRNLGTFAPNYLLSSNR